MGVFDVFRSFNENRVASAAKDLLILYFAFILALVLLNFGHGFLYSILPSPAEGTPQLEATPFTWIVHNTNVVFLTVLLLPVGVFVLGILVANLYIPFFSTFIVDLLENMFQLWGWDFTEWVVIHDDGSKTLAILDASQLTTFYFDLVASMSELLLDIAVPT